jgi:hypothetical protein
MIPKGLLSVAQSLLLLVAEFLTPKTVKYCIE